MAVDPQTDADFGKDWGRPNHDHCLLGSPGPGKRQQEIRAGPLGLLMAVVTLSVKEPDALRRIDVVREILP